MTKRKTGVFHGAWLDRRVPGELLRPRIKNENAAIDADQIIAEIAEQVARWRFDTARINTEPEVSAWASLVAAVPIPKNMTTRELAELRAAINTLPLRVKAGMSDFVFQRTDRFWDSILGDAIVTGDLSGIDAIVDFLREAPPVLKRLRGKRGPKLDCGPALRAVTCVILSNSKLQNSRARALAADLLGMCGVRVPTGKSQQVEKIRPRT